MSIHSPDLSGHITITTPGATALLQGPFTIGILCKNIAFASNFVWYLYQADNFSHGSLYFDGDLWYDSTLQIDSNLDTSDAFWRYLVVTKAGGSATPRAHVGAYVSSGAISWYHADFPSTRGNFSAVNRMSIGDEFGNGFRGDAAMITGFTSEMDDAEVQANFIRSSADILALTPQFFVHWPESIDLGDSFEDLAGGGIETIRTGTWSLSDDPDGYNFLLGRSGKPKTYSGTTWDAHPAKVWNGSAWVTHSMKGYTGTEFLASK